MGCNLMKGSGPWIPGFKKKEKTRFLDLDSGYPGKNIL